MTIPSHLQPHAYACRSRQGGVCDCILAVPPTLTTAEPARVPCGVTVADGRNTNTHRCYLPEHPPGTNHRCACGRTWPV